MLLVLLLLVLSLAMDTIRRCLRLHHETSLFTFPSACLVFAYTSPVDGLCSHWYEDGASPCRHRQRVRLLLFVHLREFPVSQGPEDWLYFKRPVCFRSASAFVGAFDLVFVHVCVMIHVSFPVLLCICWCTAGERWLRDMDLAHWVCELWLNPWVYCFRHALTTSPQWPGSRLHSSRGGPLLTHSHPLLPLPPPSLPPLIPSLFPPVPCFTSLLYPPSPLNFSQSLPSCCVFFFSQPLLFSLLSLFLWHCCQQDRNCLLASGRNRSCRPANGNRQAVFNTLTSWSSLWNEFLCGWNGRSGSFHNNNINPDLILRF